MTIVFGFVTDEFLFLAADGRQSTAFEVITNEAEKIVSINDSFAIAVLGAVIGSNLALDFVSKHIAYFDYAETIKNRIQEGVFIGAKHVMSIVRPQDLSRPTMKVGMIGGGLDVKGPYLVGSLFGTMMDKPSTVLLRGTGTGPGYVVLGGDCANADSHFANELVRILHASPSNLEMILSMLLGAVKATVQHTALFDKTVGGRIQYRLQSAAGELRTGFLT